MGLGDILIRIEGQTSGFENALKKTEKNLNNTARRMERTANALIPSLTLPIAGIGIAALSARGDLQRLENSLSSALGRADAGAAALKQFAEDAKLPGVAFEGLAKGVVKLQAVGIEAGQARDIMLTFGNALELAGGSASDLDGVQLALGQIISKGKISAEEINQLAERIPQVRKAIEAAFGTANSEDLQKLGIEVEEFVAGVTQELAKLPRAQDSLANSFEVLRDTSKRAFGEIGKSIAESTGLTDKLSNLASIIDATAKSFAGLGDGTKNAIISLSAYLALLGPTLKVVSGLKFAYSATVGLLRQQVGAFNANVQIIKNYRAAQIALASATTKAQIASAKEALQVAKSAAVKKAARLAVVGLGLALAAFAVKTFVDKLNQVDRAGRAVKKALGEAFADTRSEQNKVQVLVDRLKDSNITLAEQERLLNKLKEVSPEYFGELEAGQKVVKGLDAAFTNFSANLRLSSELDAISQAITGVSREIIELENKSTALEDVSFLGGLKALGSIGAGSRAVRAQFDESAKETRDAAIAELEKTRAKLEAKQLEVANSFENFLGSVRRKRDREPISSGEDIVDVEKVTEDIVTDLEQAVLDSNARLATLAPLDLNLDTSTLDTKNLEEADAILKDLAGSVRRAEQLGRALGSSFDVNSAKVQAHKNAVQELIEEGYGAFSPEVQKVIASLAELDDSTKNLEGIERIKELNDSLNSYVGDLVADLGGAVLDNAAELVAGNQTVEESLGSVLSTLGSGLQEFGKLLIAYAVSIEAFKNAFGNPIVAGAAGIALIATGAAVKAYAKRLETPKLAQGGLAFGETLAVVGDNPRASVDPEVIAPLSKLKEYMGEGNGTGDNFTISHAIRGEELHVLLTKTKRRYNSIHG